MLMRNNDHLLNLEYVNQEGVDVNHSHECCVKFGGLELYSKSTARQC